MKATETRDQEGLFAARVGLGLRELDGIEQAPNVSAEVARRLPGHAVTKRAPLRWLAVAAAVLAIGVTATLLVEKNSDIGAADPAVTAHDPQDPVGPWRLVYELPLDDLQRSLRGNEGEDLEQVLTRSLRSLQTRVGKRATVTRGDATTVTVTFANAAAGEVAHVRSLIETAGKLEMRIVADEDNRSGARFDLGKERVQLQAWLDGGGRERVQQDPRVFAEYSTASDHVRWFVHRVRPSAARPGFWQSRYADALAQSTVAAHVERDWNDGTIPAHCQALAVEQRFLVEFLLVDMHETHFGEGDLDPASIKQTTDPAGRGAIDYRLHPAKVGDYAAFSEKFIGKACALAWNDEVIVAPIFRGRIPGVGRLEGLAAAQASIIAGILRTPIAAKPRLVRSESARAR